ncbi:MAG: glycosyltransferase [Schaedlerella sp.]|nr:glycosyltransferase [Schaedlerella sp.]
MKRILMTNLYFAKYTGSELHTLEMARLFAEKGYEATIAVFQKTYPLLEKAEEFHVINCLTEKLPENSYDIIWVQHYPVFDYLRSRYELKYKNLIVSKLSVISELEYLPVCTPQADLILCVSQECADAVCEEIGHDPRIWLFKNCASEEYFKEYPVKKEDAQLHKIAVISNHIPEELLELSKEIENDIEIDYVGVEQSPRLVDAEFLKKYDLIITIGRTVQHCFAMGVPIYVYDYFGGPGYINDENFAVAEKNNFSGRGFSKKDVKELKKDIIDNFEKNLSYLKKLNRIAKKEYSYEKCFEEIYQKLMELESETFRTTKFFDKVENSRMRLYSKVVPAYALPKTSVSQLYIDYKDGFCEENSIKWEAAENYVIKRQFKTDRRVKGLRFDPCDVPAECYVYEIQINGKTKYSKKYKQFLDFDPQFKIELSKEERNVQTLQIEIVYKFKTLSWEKTLELYKEKLDGEKFRHLENMKNKVISKVKNIKR